MRPNGSKGRVFAVGDPARRSRDGDGKILVRGGEVMAAKRTTAQRGFAQRNGAERRQAPGCERGASRGTKERTPADPAGICGATFEQIENGVASTLPPAGATTGQPGFAAGEMRPNGNKGRVFAVGDPARQSRDGDGKILVRGDEVMAAKRTTAQGGVRGVKCDRTGARAGAGTEAACGKRGRPPAVAGTITSLRRPTFLALRK